MIHTHVMADVMVDDDDGTRDVSLSLEVKRDLWCEARCSKAQGTRQQACVVCGVCLLSSLCHGPLSSSSPKRFSVSGL